MALLAQMILRGTFGYRTAAGGIAFGMTAAYFGLLWWKSDQTHLGALILLPIVAAVKAAVRAASMV